MVATKHDNKLSLAQLLALYDTEPLLTAAASPTIEPVAPIGELILDPIKSFAATEGELFRMRTSLDLLADEERDQRKKITSEIERATAVIHKKMRALKDKNEGELKISERSRLELIKRVEAQTRAIAARKRKTTSDPPTNDAVLQKLDAKFKQYDSIVDGMAARASVQHDALGAHLRIVQEEEQRTIALNAHLVAMRNMVQVQLADNTRYADDRKELSRLQTATDGSIAALSVHTRAFVGATESQEEDDLRAPYLEHLHLRARAMSNEIRELRSALIQEQHDAHIEQHKLYDQLNTLEDQLVAKSTEGEQMASVAAAKDEEFRRALDALYMELDRQTAATTDDVIVALNTDILQLRQGIIDAGSRLLKFNSELQDEFNLITSERDLVLEEVASAGATTTEATARALGLKKERGAARTAATAATAALAAAVENAATKEAEMRKTQHDEALTLTKTREHLKEVSVQFAAFMATKDAERERERRELDKELSAAAAAELLPTEERDASTIQRAFDRLRALKRANALATNVADDHTKTMEKETTQKEQRNGAKAVQQVQTKLMEEAKASVASGGDEWQQLATEHRRRLSEIGPPGTQLPESLNLLRNSIETILKNAHAGPVGDDSAELEEMGAALLAVIKELQVASFYIEDFQQQHSMGLGERATRANIDEDDASKDAVQFAVDVGDIDSVRKENINLIENANVLREEIVAVNLENIILLRELVDERSALEEAKEELDEQNETNYDEQQKLLTSMWDLQASQRDIIGKFSHIIAQVEEVGGYSRMGPRRHLLDAIGNAQRRVGAPNRRVGAPNRNPEGINHLKKLVEMLNTNKDDLNILGDLDVALDSERQARDALGRPIAHALEHALEHALRSGAKRKGKVSVKFPHEESTATTNPKFHFLGDPLEGGGRHIPLDILRKSNIFKNSKFKESSLDSVKKTIPNLLSYEFLFGDL